MEHTHKPKINVEEHPSKPLIALRPDENEILNRLREVIEKYEAYSSTIQQISDRNRLKGAGIRRYGFIEATHDIAAENMEYAPGFFDIAALSEAIRQIEAQRLMLIETQKLAKMISDGLLISGDNGYSLALVYYNAVREASRSSANMPGAKAIFNRLRTFFSTRRMPAGLEPTKKQIKHDVNAIIDGKKDGEIVLKNEAPHLEGGKHLVIDETRKPGGHFKATEEGETEQ